MTEPQSAIPPPTTLVTGAAGFIGSNLCDRLLARGERVIGVDNFNDYYDPAWKRLNIAPALEHPNFRLYEADFRDMAAMREIFVQEQPSRIAHIGGMAGVRYSLAQPDLYLDVNVRGTGYLLELAREFPVSVFVYASSSSVYGNSPVPFHEDDPCNQPVSPYAASKKAAELLGYTYHSAYGLNFTALRFFTVYGPRNRPDMAVGNFTRHIRAGTPLILYGDGSMGRDYTYIDDHLSGVIAALDKPLGYEVINLGNSHPETTARLIEIIEQVVGKRAVIERRPPHPADAENTYADISKAQRLLGYQPTTRLEQGIAQYVQWLERF